MEKEQNQQGFGAAVKILDPNYGSKR